MQNYNELKEGLENINTALKIHQEKLKEYNENLQSPDVEECLVNMSKITDEWDQDLYKLADEFVLEFRELEELDGPGSLSIDSSPFR